MREERTCRRSSLARRMRWRKEVWCDDDGSDKEEIIESEG